MESDELRLKPIGYIATPFRDKYHAPRQPGGAASEALITLLPGQNFEQALEDLAEFEKIWLIYWFHKNSSWKPKVLPTRSTGLDRSKRGVFATRSPHRPNPIGLSLVTLLEIRGRTLRVADTDLLDGTPILDIKPYLPYAEAFPEARTGWLEENPPAASYSVEWSPLAEDQRSWLERNFSIKLAERVVPVLASDPFPHPYKRISRVSDRHFQIAVKSWRVIFAVDGHVVLIEKITSGYSMESVFSAAPATLHEQEAHREFYTLWSAFL